MKASQIKSAETFGMINYEQGIICAPAQSNELMGMLAKRQIGKTPKNEATTIELMKAWTNGWHKAKEIANA
jgi:hypothetical protein